MFFQSCGPTLACSYVTTGVVIKGLGLKKLMERGREGVQELVCENQLLNFQEFYKFHC